MAIQSSACSARGHGDQGLSRTTLIIEITLLLVIGGLLGPPRALADPGPSSEADQATEAACQGLDLIQALELLLANDPQLGLAEAVVESSRGLLRQEQASFEPSLTGQLTRSTISTPKLGTDPQRTETLATTVTLTQRLRSGLSLEPSLELDRDEIDAAGAVNTGTLRLTVRQPLLQQRRRAVITGDEQVAELELEISTLSLRHTVSTRLLAAITQYWRLRASALELEILRASEESSRELLATTRRLIAADQTPAAEAVQLEADLAAKEAASLGGERSLFSARQELGRELGLTHSLIDSLDQPCEPFPEISLDGWRGSDHSSQSEQLIALALDRRWDLQVARQRLRQAEIAVTVKRDGLQPALDLVLSPSYSGIMQGGQTEQVLGGLYRHSGGLSASLGVDLSWPVTYADAEGELVVAEATLSKRRLEIDALERSIQARVPSALDAVRRGALQLAKAEAAVRLYEQAVENEEKKLRAGSSTLLDVISQQDRLTAARQRLVSARLALAIAIAELRWEIGALLEGTSEEEVYVSRTRMTRIPEPTLAAPRFEERAR